MQGLILIMSHWSDSGGGASLFLDAKIADGLMALLGHTRPHPALAHPMDTGEAFLTYQEGFSGFGSAQSMVLCSRAKRRSAALSTLWM